LVVRSLVAAHVPGSDSLVFENSRGGYWDADSWYSINFVWQSGMGTILGILARRSVREPPTGGKTR
jgi:hypothetical protein